MQIDPSQHPWGHEIASQTHSPAVFGLHVWPAAQAPQAAPPVPHEELDCDAYGTQVEPSQQPNGHVVESQTH